MSFLLLTTKKNKINKLFRVRARMGGRLRKTVGVVQEWKVGRGKEKRRERRGER